MWQYEHTDTQTWSMVCSPVDCTYIKLCVASQVIRTQQQWDLYAAHDFTAQNTVRDKSTGTNAASSDTEIKSLPQNIFNFKVNELTSQSYRPLKVL